MRLKLIAYILLVVGIAGCKKDEEKTPDPITPVECSSLLPNKLSATIGTESWCANQYCDGTNALDMDLVGLNNNASSITLILKDFTPGTYPVNGIRNYIGYDASDAFEPTNTNPGSITILSNDTITKLIKGTFSVTLTSPDSVNVNISNGKFSIYYIF